MRKRSSRAAVAVQVAVLLCVACQSDGPAESSSQMVAGGEAHRKGSPVQPSAAEALRAELRRLGEGQRIRSLLVRGGRDRRWLQLVAAARLGDRWRLQSQLPGQARLPGRPLRLHPPPGQLHLSCPLAISRRSTHAQAEPRSS
jgi:hypothetical protein